MSLPEACEKCAEFGGYWVESDRGMRRCDCPRGRALLEMAAIAARPPEPKDPVITADEAEVFTEMLSGAVSYFPGIDSTFARAMVGAEIRAMCANVDQAREFITRFARLYRKWPGVAEFRWAFCQMGFRPLDAIEPIGDSEIFPDGLPESAGGRPAVALESPRDPRSRELPPGEAGNLIRELAGRKAL